MDLQNNVNELITLRTNGVEDAMKSMKDIESLFDRVTSNYRPLLNGERYLCRTIGTTALFLISSWVVRCCTVRVTWRHCCKDVITLLSLKRRNVTVDGDEIAHQKGKQKKGGCTGCCQASVFLLFICVETVAYGLSDRCLKSMSSTMTQMCSYGFRS